MPVPDINDENVEEIDYGMMNNYGLECEVQVRNANPELAEGRRLRNTIARCLYNR